MVAQGMTKLEPDGACLSWRNDEPEVQEGEKGWPMRRSMHLSAWFSVFCAAITACRACEAARYV